MIQLGSIIKAYWVLWPWDLLHQGIQDWKVSWNIAATSLFLATDNRKSPKPNVKTLELSKNGISDIQISPDHFLKIKPWLVSSNQIFCQDFGQLSEILNFQNWTFSQCRKLEQVRFIKIIKIHSLVEIYFFLKF